MSYYLNEISLLRQKFFSNEESNNLIGAMEVGEKMLSLYKSNNDVSSELYTKDIFNLAVIYDSILLHEKALNLYREISRVQLKLLGEDSLEYADTLNNIAVDLNMIKQNSEALGLHKKVHLIRESSLGRNHIETIYSLLNIGNTYDNLGRYENAVDFLRRALARAERNPDFNKLEYSDILSSLARVYSKLGNCSKSIRAYTKAINIIKNEMGENNHYYLRILGESAKVCVEAEKYEMAIIYYTKILNIRKELTSANNCENFTDLNLLASAYALNNQRDEAVENFSKALRIITELFGSNHVFYADILVNKGISMMGFKEYDEAMSLFMKAYTIKEKALGEDSLTLAEINSNIIKLCIEKGEFDKALDYCSNSFDIRKKSPDTIQLLKSYKEFGSIYKAEGDYEKAVEYLIMANDIYSQNPSEKKTGDYGLLLGEISEILALDGHFSLAIKYASDSLTTMLEVFGNRHPAFVSALVRLGKRLIEDGDFSLGISNLEKGLESYENIYGIENSNYIKTKKLLNDSYLENALSCLSDEDYIGATRFFNKYERDLELSIKPSEILGFAGAFIADNNFEKAYELISLVSEKKLSKKINLLNQWISLKRDSSLEAAEELLKTKGSGFDSIIYYDIGQLYRRLDKLELSIESLEKSLNRSRLEKKPHITNLIADNYIKLGRYDSAISHIEYNINYFEKKGLTEKDEYFVSLSELYTALKAKGDYKSLCGVLDKLLDFIVNNGNMESEHVMCLTEYAKTCIRLDRMADASEYMIEAAARIKSLEGESERYGDTIYEISKIMLLDGDFSNAKAYVDNSIKVYLEAVGRNSKKYMAGLLHLGDILYFSGKDDEASKAYEEAYNLSIENDFFNFFNKDSLERLKNYYRENKIRGRLSKIKSHKLL